MCLQGFLFINTQCDAFHWYLRLDTLGKVSHLRGKLLSLLIKTYNLKWLIADLNSCNVLLIWLSNGLVAGPNWNVISQRCVVTGLGQSDLDLGWNCSYSGPSAPVHICRPRSRVGTWHSNLPGVADMNYVCCMCALPSMVRIFHLLLRKS